MVCNVLIPHAAFPGLTGNANNGLRWPRSCPVPGGTAGPPSPLPPSQVTADKVGAIPLCPAALTSFAQPFPPAIPARAAYGVAPVPGTHRGGSGAAPPPWSPPEPVTSTSSTATPAQRQQHQQQARPARRSAGAAPGTARPCAAGAGMPPAQLRPLSRPGRDAPPPRTAQPPRRHRRPGRGTGRGGRDGGRRAPGRRRLTAGLGLEGEAGGVSAGVTAAPPAPPGAGLARAGCAPAPARPGLAGLRGR